MISETDEDVRHDEELTHDALIAFEILLSVVGAKKLNEWLEAKITELLEKK